jgi:hypothetical protein
MSRTRTRASIAATVVLSIVLGGVSAGVVGAGPAHAADDLLPNLRMVPLADWTIQNVNGRRLLRFTTVMANQGPGAFEVKGHRKLRSDDQMRIDQVIFDTAGGKRRVKSGAVAEYAGDGHDHWHVQRMMTYELYKVDGQSVLRAGAKTGFCFLDTTAWRLGLPNARPSPYYREEWCGVGRSLTMRIGISVGWGDKYPWNFAFQWIDITGLPSGRYVVRSTVDIGDWFDETNEYDNCKWSEIRIPSQGNSVTVLDSGGGCGEAAISPADDFTGSRTFDPPRHIIFEAGTYTGRTFNALGTELRTKRRTVDHTSGGWALHRGKIPGRTGNWFYVVDGLLAGYWVRDSPRIDFAANP